MAKRRFKSNCYRQNRKSGNQNNEAKFMNRKRLNKSRKGRSKQDRQRQAKLFAAKKHIINLSKYELKMNEILVLGKGMKFIPTPCNKYAKVELMRDVNEYIRKLRCRFNYYKNEKEVLHPLYTQTGHVSPKGNAALENYITDLKLIISQIEINHNNTTNNMSIEERKALKDLSNNEEILITKADKNNTTVVIDKTKYIEEGEKHLQSIYYEQIADESTSEILKIIDNKIRRMYAMKEIDEVTYRFLSNKDQAKHGTIRFQPKIHKIDVEIIKELQKNLSCNKEIHIQYRPIINKSKAPTRRIEKLLNLILKPELKKHSTYIQDTKDFINRIESHKCKKKCKIVAYDISTMYLNIHIHELIESINETIDNLDNNNYKFKVPRPEDLKEFA